MAATAKAAPGLPTAAQTGTSDPAGRAAWHNNPDVLYMFDNNLNTGHRVQRCERGELR